MSTYFLEDCQRYSKSKPYRRANYAPFQVKVLILNEPSGLAWVDGEDAARAIPVAQGGGGAAGKGV